MSKPIPKKLAEDLSVKYKHNDVTVDRVFDDSVERAMFEDILSANRRPGSASASRSSDISFNTTLIQRLREAEQELFGIQKEHKRLKNYTSLLHAENEELKRNLNRQSSHTEYSEREVHLARENKALRNQIHEMEQFLSDYGLTWVGSAGGAAGSGDSVPQMDHRPSSEKLSVPASSEFTKFSAKIAELNDAIRAEPTQIVTDAKRAKFVHAAESVNSLKLTYYRNGLLINRGPFRHCESDSFHTFVRDIMDGYFPSELQADNPDGVIIDLKDQSHIDYSDSAANEDRMTGFQLLKRLPKQIVKNGEIIEVADDISRKIGLETGNSGPAQKVELAKGFIEPIQKKSNMDSPTLLKQPIHLQYSGNRVVTPSKKTSDKLPHSLKDSNSPISTSLFGSPDTDKQKDVTETLAVVQVKCGNGGPTFVLKLPEDSHIFDLRNMISEYFAKESFDSSQIPKFELRSAFPPRVLTDMLSMNEAGLVPNGTIHAKILR